MIKRSCILFVLVLGVIGCAKKEIASGKSPSSTARTTAGPSKKLTVADVAKLKWIEGTWKGMDGETPFYERYKVEESALVVEGLKEDGSPDGEPGRFELKNGEFGKTEGQRRSVASEIGDGFVQFVPAVAGKGNNFRFEKQSDDSWMAILEWPATPDKPARSKVYRMERFSPTR